MKRMDRELEAMKLEDVELEETLKALSARVEERNVALDKQVVNVGQIRKEYDRLTANLRPVQQRWGIPSAGELFQQPAA
jgi:hypothetical protein